MQATLERQIDNDDARGLLLLQLAVENANNDCKRVLQPTKNRNPSLADMIRACQDIGSTGHQADALANA
ncbi:hypothetical protein FK518_29990, partial [Klebsiella pneumoniae]|nr:hypothetical protein [Klebsiella pneumoniae]